MARVRYFVLLVGAVAAVAACRPARPAAPADPPVPVAFDHLILAVDSFAQGVALLRAATGVTPLVVEADPAALAAAGGGGQGTQSALLQNAAVLQSAIIGLGGGRYLELVGPSPAGLAAPEVRDEFAMYRGLEPIAWGVRTPSVAGLRDAFAARHARAGEVRAGARDLAGWGALRWRTLTPWASVSTLYPAFIEWDPQGAHPSDAAPAGCTLLAFALGSPDADAMRAPLTRAGVATRVAVTTRREMDATLDCPTGRVQLPSRAP